MIQGKDKKFDIVKAFHGDYVFIIAKHPRFSWVSHSEEDHMYFVYITRTENRFVDKKTANVAKFNVLCCQQVFYNYHQMMMSLEPILSEYILDSKSIFKICILAQNLEYYLDEEDKQIASGE